MGADLANSARRRAISSPCMLSISLLLTMAVDRSGRWVVGAAVPEGTMASAVLAWPAAGAAAAAAADAAAAAAAAAAGSMTLLLVVLVGRSPYHANRSSVN